MERTVTCINCPVGCRMTVILTDAGGFVSVTGNTCPRGAAYAEQECTHRHGRASCRQQRNTAFCQDFPSGTEKTDSGYHA